MAFLSSLNIAASGMAAERLRLDVISQNVANAKPPERRTVRRTEDRSYCSAKTRVSTLCLRKL